MKKQTFEKEQITESLLATMLNRQVTAWVKHYSYHEHLTQVSGTVIRHDQHPEPPVYMVKSNEAYSIDSIFRIKEGWD